MAVMAQTKDIGGTNRPRRSRGFQVAATLLSPQLRRAAERRGFAVARLLTHWSEVAGEDIAAMARPLKISHGNGGFGATLTLLTTGPAAPLVQMQLPRLRERVNACYGYNAVQRILLTQTAPEGFADGQAVFDHAPKIAAPDPQATAQAQGVAQKFSDPDLAQAMERLTLNHAERQKSRKMRKEAPC